MRRIVWGFLLAATCAAGLLLWTHRRPSIPTQRLAVRADGVGGPGLALVVSDLYEVANRRIIVPVGTVPPAGTHLLTLHLSRRDADLVVDAEMDGRPLPRQEGTPSQVLSGLAKALALPTPGAAFMPVDPGDGFDLLDLAGLTQDDATADRVAKAHALVLRVPGCASARLAFGTLQTRFLVEHMEADTLDAQRLCEQNFQDGLGIIPNYPRFVALYAVHLSDIRRQPEALRLLQSALKQHPGNASLLNSLAYAARTSGLLELADRALQRRSSLADLPRGQASLADNTLLYEGKYKAFETSLSTLQPGPLRNFYLGYTRLIEGDRDGAHALFAATQPGGLGSTLFVRLAEVYRLALEGRTQEANQALDTLDAERIQIRLPDGEFTFKVAEAYGFMGRPGDALEAAVRASIQGFSCTPWYERAPFLAEARKLPRWTSLDLHLKERQRIMEASFPASSFAL